MTSGTAEARARDLRVRAISGLAMIVVALAALVIGGLAFWLLAAAAAMLMLGEWGGLAHAPLRRIRFAMIALAFPLIVALPMVLGPSRDAVAALAVAALAVAISGGGGRMAAGVVYVGLPVLGLLYLRDRPDGIALALWTLAIVWATDIGAYFAGRRFGGPKLAPIISPNKTWSGLIGGVIAATLVGAGIAAAAGLPGALLWAGAPLAVAAQIGDLFESWLKRRAGAKDSGRLLPGHGGALDRLDGLVPVATIVAFAGAAGWL